MASSKRAPRIHVLAGTNGAGKSSIGGAIFNQHGIQYFNPDGVAARLRADQPGASLEESQSAAWQQGKSLLERVIANRMDFAFETTLGGNTIPALLERAMAEGFEVRIWYAGLASPELHIERVRSRVAHGGHNIPESRIRERYHRSILNLLRLLPGLAELRVYDNSHDGDPFAAAFPQPRLLLHFKNRRIVTKCAPALTPAWAKPILLAALKINVS